MDKKELLESNYMAALLRAALLLGDLHHTPPVRGITISAFQIRGHTRHLYLRCRIIVQDSPFFHPDRTTHSALAHEEYLILYPVNEST